MYSWSVALHQCLEWVERHAQLLAGTAFVVVLVSLATCAYAQGPANLRPYQDPKTPGVTLFCWDTPDGVTFCQQFAPISPVTPCLITPGNDDITCFLPPEIRPPKVKERPA